MSRPGVPVQVLGLAAAVACASCTSPPLDALLICHNANCAGPGSVDRDDTLDALEASLGLESDGRPVLDGIEIDTIWDAARNRCVFAHSLDGAPAPDVARAIAIVADHLRRLGAASARGNRFHVKLELKTRVDGSGASHDTEQAAAHAGCLLRGVDTLDQATARGGHDLTVIFDSDSPALLQRLTLHPRWPGKNPRPGLRLALETGYDARLPPDLAVDILTIHWRQIGRETRNQLVDRDIDLLVWGRDPSSATLDAIEYVQPRFLGFNAALWIRRWLDR